MKLDDCEDLLDCRTKPTAGVAQCMEKYGEYIFQLH